MLDLWESNFNDKFFQRIFFVSKGKEEILATSYNNCFSIVWRVNSFKPRFGCSTFHIHNILSDNYFRNISFLSWQCSSTYKRWKHFVSSSRRKVFKKKTWCWIPLQRCWICFRSLKLEIKWNRSYRFFWKTFFKIREITRNVFGFRTQRLCLFFNVYAYLVKRKTFSKEILIR